MRAALCLAAVTLLAASTGGRTTAAGACLQVPPGGDYPSWVNGTTLAFVASGAETDSVATVDVATTKPACIVATVPEAYAGTGVDAVAVARGRVFFVSNFQLFRRNLKTGRVRDMLGIVDALSVPFVLSPNGRHVAVTADCRCASVDNNPGTGVGVMPATGGPFRWLSDRWPSHAQDPTFSPNGRKVAFATPTGIAIESIHGGLDAFLPVPGFCQGTTWSPNGRWIACDGETLELVNASSGAVRSIPGQYSAYSWAPDSLKLAVSGPHDLIGTVGLTGGLRVLATLGPNWPASGEPPAWSTSHLIAFSVSATRAGVPDRIYVVRPNGKGLRRVA
jgi:hypothetical protein